MPTTLTHAAVGLGLAEIFSNGTMPATFWLLTLGLSELPDVDVLAFRLGIPYGARFGHRGFFHSLFFALVIGSGVAALSYTSLGVTWWMLAVFFFGVVATHDLLDAFTNGGMGIALLSPFDDRRYFFPWRPIQVSPVGLASLSRLGLRALRSEIVWVWLPLTIVLGLVWMFRQVFV